MRRFRTGLIVISAVLVLFGAPLAVLIASPMRYAGLIEHAVRLTTGLELSFKGLQLGLFPPRLATANLRIVNPDTSFGKPVLDIDALSLTVDTHRLFSDAPDWWSGEASGVVFSSGHDAQGRSLWTRPGHRTRRPGQAGYPGPLFSFEAVRISGLDYHLVSGETTRSVHVAQLSVHHEPHRRLKVALTAAYRNQPITASGTLALPGGEHPKSIDFQATVVGAHLHVNGTLDNDDKAAAHVTIAADAGQMAALGRLLKVNLSPYAPVAIEADVQTPRADHWTLSAAGRLAGHGVNLDATASGTARNLQLDKLTARFGDSDATASAKLNLAARKLSATIVSRRLDIDQLAFTRQRAAEASRPEGRSLNYRPIDLGLLHRWTVDVELQVGDLQYRRYEVKKLDLDGRSNAGKLDFSADMGKVTARNGKALAWQLNKPLHVDGTLSSTGGAGALSLKYRSTGVSGQFDTTLPAKAHAPLPLRLTTTIRNFSFLSGINTKGLDKALPLEVALHAQARGKELRIDPFTVHLHGNELDGHLDLDVSRTPPGISGKIHSRQLDLNRTFMTSANRAAGRHNTGSRKSTQVFGRQPVPSAWLDAVTLDIGIRVDQLRFNQTTFRKVDSHLSLRNGQLRIEPLAASLKKGGVRGHLRVRKVSRGVAIDAHLIATNLVPADLGALNKELMAGGETDLSFDLRARGATPHALAGTLDGTLTLEIRQATIRNDLFERLGSDLLVQTVNLINPFAERNARTELVCAAAHFDIADGVLSTPDQILIETTKTIIRGGGYINLGKETLQLDLVPSPRSGLGIGVGNVARIVRLGGTLRAPHAVAAPVGILESGATVGAAIATGGVSLLAEGLYNRLRNATTSCGDIFEHTVKIPKGLKPPD